MDILVALKAEESKLAQQLETVRQAIKVIQGGNVNGSGRNSGRTKGTMSAAGRARIAAAQRKRWAKIRKQKKT
jgi:hypothetical protein